MTKPKFVPVANVPVPPPPTLVECLKFDLKSRERRLANAIRHMRDRLDDIERDLQRGSFTQTGNAQSVGSIGHQASELDVAAAELGAMREALVWAMQDDLERSKAS